jgi:hypothetical protein
MGRREVAKIRSIGWEWKFFGWIGFLGRVQRRGGGVNIPEKGSRDGEIVFGGILRFHAVLRREYCWGKLDLGFLRV